MMLYHTQNYWVFGHFPSSGILGNREHDVRKLDLFPSSGVKGKTPIQLGPLDTAKLNHWIEVSGRWKKSKNPVILSNFDVGVVILANNYQNGDGTNRGALKRTLIIFV
jgi:hypothetical protein